MILRLECLLALVKISLHVSIVKTDFKTRFENTTILIQVIESDEKKPTALSFFEAKSCQGYLLIYLLIYSCLCLVDS